VADSIQPELDPDPSDLDNRVTDLDGRLGDVEGSVDALCSTVTDAGC
jgi:hypothetical protein